MSVLDKIKEKAASEKKESVSIPSGSIVDALLIGIKYTKKGEEEASILGGIGVKFAFLGYYTGEGKDAKYVQTIDYSDLDNIKFPADILEKDGSISRPGLMSNGPYLSKGVLEFEKFHAPEDEQGRALMYAHLMGRWFGEHMCEPFLSCLGNSGLVPKLDPIEIGMSNGKFSELFPIVQCYRETWWSYDKKDLDENTKKPVEGARKTQFNEKLTVWNKTTKSAELGNADIKFIDANTAMKISEALSKRQEQKNLEKGGSPF